MSKNDIIENLECKQKKPEELVQIVIKNPKLIRELFDGTTSNKASVKFGTTKILRIISEQKPKLLYPHMDFFIELMNSQNQILKWNAMDIIANLTKIDSENKFDEIFNDYYKLISDDVMITAGHVVDNSGKIVAAKPHLQTEISKKLLTVESTKLSDECRNILIGKAILAFGTYFESIENKDQIISFVERQLKNSRKATKNKAEKFLKKATK
jgi:predicted house-cleaning noncanonical NTP pyrophosphatase (MazG superfamily)